MNNPNPPPSNEGASFTHTPLTDATKQIRLLRLVAHPQASNISTLQYELSIHDLDETPEYRAISYAWGSTNTLEGEGEGGEEEDILVCGVPTKVRRTCRYALWQISLHMPDSWLWIDALCINQEDVEEKNAQVQMMGKIFQRADLVAASLGPHADDSERIYSFKGKYRSRYQRGQGRDEEDLLLEAARDAFAERPFWRRLWIVQELYLAQHAWLMCGEDVIRDWKRTHSKLFLLDHGQIYEALSAGGNRQFEILMSEKERRRGRRKRAALILLEAIPRFASFECQDPRDHVYALLSICTAGQSSVKVDYGASLLTLAMEVAQNARKTSKRYRDARFFCRAVAYLFEALDLSGSACKRFSNLDLKYEMAPASGSVEANQMRSRLEHIQRQIRAQPNHSLEPSITISKAVAECPDLTCAVVTERARLVRNASGRLVIQVKETHPLGTTDSSAPVIVSDKRELRLLQDEHGQERGIGRIYGTANAGDILLELIWSQHLILFVLVRNSAHGLYDVTGFGISLVEFVPFQALSERRQHEQFMLVVHHHDLLAMAAVRSLFARAVEAPQVENEQAAQFEPTMQSFACLLPAAEAEIPSKSSQLDQVPAILPVIEEPMFNDNYSVAVKPPASVSAPALLPGLDNSIERVYKQNGNIHSDSQVGTGVLSRPDIAPAFDQPDQAKEGNHALQDYQLQLMLLEQRNKNRLQEGIREQDRVLPTPRAQL